MHIAQRLDVVTGTISALLLKQGFIGPVKDVAQGVTFHDWVRETAWSTETIQIDHAVKRRPDVRMKVFVRIKLDEVRSVGIDGASVAYLLGGGLGFDWLNPEAIRVKEEVTRATSRALEWLLLYATPERAIERLPDDSRNGCGKGTRPYVEAEEQLRAHAAGGRIANR